MGSHWHRLVKNIGGKPKSWKREKVTITDENIRAYQLLGACSRVAATKAYAYGWDFNWAKDVHWRTEVGRLFQRSLGNETEKAWLPNFRFVLSTAKSPLVVDRIVPDKDVVQKTDKRNTHIKNLNNLPKPAHNRGAASDLVTRDLNTFTRVEYYIHTFI